MTHFLIWYGKAARKRASGRPQTPTARMTTIEVAETIEVETSEIIALGFGHRANINTGKFWIEKEI